ncbi:MAG: PD-(D/E)XK nuclease family protein [Planctomycetales bacterium]|nr:PD-(D/E)XK nuclease family protein [Planctomycetales bacterium]
MADSVIEIENQIDSLLTDERYARLTQIEPEFDLFEFLQTLSEDASSRALAFLLDSSREHELGTRFFDALIDNVHREGSGRTHRLSLRQSLGLHGQSTSVATEWATSDGRRLDLLIRVYDSMRNLIAVVGIENKHWAAEQPEQVSHYQNELVKRFPHVGERVLLFLSPGARPSSTADLTCECPYVPCSYRTVIAALEEAETLADGEIRVFITSLKSHLDKNLEGSHAMSAQIRDLVRAIYRDPKHRNAIKHILDHIPRFGTLVNEIQDRVELHLATNYPNEPFTYTTYPKTRLDRLQEIQALPVRLAERTKDADGFSFYYLLHPDRTKAAADVPDLGDHVTVQLIAWCEKKDFRDNVDALALAEQLPKTIGTPDSWCSQWREVWAGGSHQLVDLGDVDAAACADLFINAIDATFPILKSVIEKKYPTVHEGE